MKNQEPTESNIPDLIKSVTLKVKAIKQTRNFVKQVKKLHPNQKSDLDKAIKIVYQDPSLGEGKTGGLSGIFVYKFKMLGQLTLLAYEYDDNNLYLLSVGSHQNFYRDLKK